MTERAANYSHWLDSCLNLEWHHMMRQVELLEDYAEDEEGQYLLKTAKRELEAIEHEMSLRMR